MNNFILIFFFLFLGLLLQKVKGFPISVYKILNKIVVYICLPAITLCHIPKIRWSNDLLFPIASGWITFILAVVFFSFFRKTIGLV